MDTSPMYKSKELLHEKYNFKEKIEGDEEESGNG